MASAPWRRAKRESRDWCWRDGIVAERLDEASSICSETRPGARPAPAGPSSGGATHAKKSFSRKTAVLSRRVVLDVLDPGAQRSRGRPRVIRKSALSGRPRCATSRLSARSPVDESREDLVDLAAGRRPHVVDAPLRVAREVVPRRLAEGEQTENGVLGRRQTDLGLQGLAPAHLRPRTTSRPPASKTCRSSSRTMRGTDCTARSCGPARSSASPPRSAGRRGPRTLCARRGCPRALRDGSPGSRPASGRAQRAAAGADSRPCQ